MIYLSCVLQAANEVHAREAVQEMQGMLSPLGTTLVLDLSRDTESLDSWRLDVILQATYADAPSIEQVARAIACDGWTYDPDGTRAVWGVLPAREAFVGGITSVALRSAPDSWGKGGRSRELLYAIRARDVGGVTRALELGVQVSRRDPLLEMSPITAAVVSEDLPILNALLASDVDMHDIGVLSDFNYENANTDVLDTLLAHGANPNERDSSGDTPLMRAVGTSTAVVRRLLEAGADPNCQTPRGETPLTYCAVWGWGVSASLLLRAGADPLWCDPETLWTPLHYAAQNPLAIGLLATLISAGADPGALTCEGYSPFDIAVYSECLRAVRQLAPITPTRRPDLSQQCVRLLHRTQQRLLGLRARFLRKQGKLSRTDRNPPIHIPHDKAVDLGSDIVEGHWKRALMYLKAGGAVDGSVLVLPEILTLDSRSPFNYHCAAERRDITLVSVSLLLSALAAERYRIASLLLTRMRIPLLEDQSNEVLSLLDRRLSDLDAGLVPR